MQKKRSFKTGSGRVIFGKKEKERLFQLGLCICLFLVLFVGRANEMFQEKQTGEKLLQIVQENTDFTAAFSSFGESVSNGESVWDGVKVLLTDLFGIKKEVEPISARTVVLNGPACENTIQRMAVHTTMDSMAKFLGVELMGGSAPAEAVDQEAAGRKTVENELPSAVQEEQLPEAPPEAEEPKAPVYDGPELPADASMDHLVLELNGTTTPVLGEISSGFGYRQHPITEEYSFHTGVDIAADLGTPIAAFADGKVEFIGESNAYGLYIQLDHGMGVKSFYCHCSELLYGKGKTVKTGQTIALVGDTGDATGAHLHLELKKEGVLLNPAYYIESLN